MNSSKIFVSILIAFIGFCLSFNLQANETIAPDAIKAATNWLQLVDEAKYGESWEAAAPYFKNATTKEKWKNLLNSGRKPLGKLLSRELKSKTYKKSLPGVPDGEYMIIQFTSSFENKGSGVETVTPMKNKAGKWEVVGYYIQ